MKSRSHVDRIRAITFKEAKDERAKFISRPWVPDRLDRRENFVKDNWYRDPHDCKMDKHQIGKRGTVLNEHERRICRLSAGTQYNSTRI